MPWVRNDFYTCRDFSTDPVTAVACCCAVFANKGAVRWRVTRYSGRCLHLWCAAGRKSFEFCSSTRLFSKIPLHICVDFWCFVLLPVLCLLIWADGSFVSAIQSSVLFLILGVGLETCCIVLECLRCSQRTADKCRSEAVLPPNRLESSHPVLYLLPFL